MHKKNHCFHLSYETNKGGIKESVIWTLSVGSFAHFLAHIVMFLPLLFGVAFSHHHDHHIGELVGATIVLNLLLHGGMALLAVFYSKNTGGSFHAQK